MIEAVGIVAGTQADLQGDVLSKKAIKSIVERVNGDRAVGYGKPNHDQFCMPLGKLAEAWIETREGHHVAVARMFYYENAHRTMHSESGNEIALLEFPDNPKPFLRTSDSRPLEQTIISVDLANFDNWQDYTKFADDVTHIDEAINCDDSTTRKAFLPEPFIQIILSHLDAAAFLGVGLWTFKRAAKFITYTADETLRKTGDELSDILSAKLKAILRKYKGRQSEDDRPIVTRIVLPGDPELNLLTRTDRDAEFQELNLKEIIAEMQKYSDLLQEADSVTLGRDGKSSWEFLYLTTMSGKVIGTSICFDKTVKLMKDIEQSQNPRNEDSVEGDSCKGPYIALSISGFGSRE